MSSSSMSRSTGTIAKGLMSMPVTIIAGPETGAAGMRDAARAPSAATRLADAPPTMTGWMGG
eukprot:12993142-Alexandrium_andersonii.AAC.1